MSFQLHELSSPALSLDPQELLARIERLVNVERVRFRRLWAYYRNPMLIGATSSGGPSDRPYRQAQEWGLPPRITGVYSTFEALPPAPPDSSALTRKEVVIENDIAWRVDAQVDYLVGKPVAIHSTAPDPARRTLIDALLQRILARNGGILFFQQLALMGSVYGFVDVLVKLVGIDAQTNHNAARPDDPAPPTAPTPSNPGDAGAPEGPRKDPAAAQTPSTGPTDALPPEGTSAPSADAAPAVTTGASGIDSREAAELERLSRMVRLEIVEPARALPVLSDRDYRDVLLYAQVYDVSRGAGGSPSPVRARPRWWGRLRDIPQRWWGGSPRFGADAGQVRIVELIGPTRWQRYEDGTLVARGRNSLGIIPLVHIQNVAVPFAYSGVSDVEPLIPLQDELNTRLSDRAHRLTLQSFKMYLAKGLENAAELPIAPGQIWTTDNPDAQIAEFGGDANCPSEEAHITDIREAIDKSSAVTPIAAGAIKNRIGRLTSAAALRVTLLALLSKTEKKRTTYGAGIARLCELALAWLDGAGLFHTRADERQVELNWPSPLPENDLEKLTEAEAKLRVGVAKEVVIKELGY